MNFNPPAPCGTGHCRVFVFGLIIPFQSARPLRDGTRKRSDWSGRNAFQSTRPLRDGTVLQPGQVGQLDHFNPPAPCGTGLESLATLTILIEFQSTRPLRDGTHVPLPLIGRKPNFNPPAPCGTGPHLSASPLTRIQFQSTRPLRDGTQLRIQFLRVILISIHPPLAGRDSKK